MPRIKGRKPESTREAALEAALWAFAEYGYENATLAIIAKRAGVTAATLPYHFHDKKGLWDAVIEAFYKQLFELATAIPSEADLEKVLETFYDWALARRNGIRVIIRNVFETGALDHQVRELRMGKAFEIVATLAARRYGSGEAAARDTTIAITHLLTRFVTNSPEDNREAFAVETDAEVRARILSILSRTARTLLGLPQAG